MLYFIYGEDVIKSHENLDNLVVKFLKEEKQSSIFRINEDSFSFSFFNDVLKTNNLFTKRNIVIVKRLFSNNLFVDYLLKNLKHLHESNNVFIFWEESISLQCLNDIKKCANNIQEFKLGKQKKDKKQQGASLFKIVDLFASRKRNELWLQYQKELFKGTNVEDIFWKIVWQVKNLLSIKNGGGKNLHPFVYKKSKNSAMLFKKQELSNYSEKLIEMYHKNRLGKIDLEVGLEKFLLRV